MGDYFHYAYQCPYLTGTKEHNIYCEGGSRITFSAVADTRRYLLRYCACEDQNWKNCSIAQARTERIERNIRTKKEIQEWIRTKEKK